MSKPYLTDYLAGTKGIFNSLPDELIPDGFFSDARNIIPKRNGGKFVKRTGVKAQSNGSTYPATFASYVTRASIYCGKNGSYYAESYTTSVPATVSNIYKLSDGTVLYTGSAAASYPGWASFGAYDIYLDANLDLKTSNGTDFTDLGATANAIIPCAYNNYLFALYPQPTPTSIIWCNVGDPTTWGTSGYSKTFNSQYRNEYLTSQRWFGSYLVVWSTHRYYMIQGYGPLDFTVTYHSFGDGCPCHELTCVSPYGLFWWSNLHGLVWSQNGVALDYPMMRNLSKTFDSMITYTPAKGTMIWRPYERCVSIYGLTANNNYSDLRVDYYPETDGFFIHDDNGSKAIAVVVDDTAPPAVYQLYRDPTHTTGKIYCRTEDATIATDIGSGFTTYFDTKREARMSTSVTKKSHEVHLTTKNGGSSAITHTVYVDNDTTGVATSATIAANVQDTTLASNLTHKKIKHRISDATTNINEYYSLVDEGEINTELK